MNTTENPRAEVFRKTMIELLGEEVGEGSLFEWLRERRDRLANLAEVCAKAPFHKASEPKRTGRIAQIETFDLALEEKAERAWLDMLEAVCEAPSFVPKICITIANIPIVMKYLDAAIAADKETP